MNRSAFYSGFLFVILFLLLAFAFIGLLLDLLLDR